jgi:hypothetical protein
VIKINERVEVVLTDIYKTPSVRILIPENRYGEEE